MLSSSPCCWMRRRFARALHHHDSQMSASTMGTSPVRHFANVSRLRRCSVDACKVTTPSLPSLSGAKGDAVSALEADLLYQRVLSRIRSDVLRHQRVALIDGDAQFYRLSRGQKVHDDSKAPSNTSQLHHHPVQVPTHAEEVLRPSIQWKAAVEASVARPSDAGVAVDPSRTSRSLTTICQVCDTPVVGAEDGIPANGHTMTNRHIVCSTLLDRLLVANSEIASFFDCEESQITSSRRDVSRVDADRRLRAWSDCRAHEHISPPSPPLGASSVKKEPSSSSSLLHQYTAMCADAMRGMTQRERLLCLPLEWGERLATPRQRGGLITASNVLGALPTRCEPLHLSWAGAVRAFRHIHKIDVSDRLASCMDVFSHRRWPAFAAQYAATVELALDFNACRRRVESFAQLGLLPVTFSHLTASDDGVRGALFERLECLGDHNFGSDSSGRLRRLFCNEVLTRPAVSNGFDELRCACEGGHNMNVVAARLKLLTLIQRGSASILSHNAKYAPDVLECMLAELRIALWANAPIDHTSPAGGGSTSTRVTTAVTVGSSTSALRRLDTVLEETLDYVMDVMVMSLVLHGHASRVHMLFRLDALFDAGVALRDARRKQLHEASDALPSNDVVTANAPDFRKVRCKRGALGAAAGTDSYSAISLRQKLNCLQMRLRSQSSMSVAQPVVPPLPDPHHVRGSDATVDAPRHKLPPLMWLDGEARCALCGGVGCVGGNLCGCKHLPLTRRIVVPKLEAMTRCLGVGVCARNDPVGVPLNAQPEQHPSAT